MMTTFHMVMLVLATAGIVVGAVASGVYRNWLALAGWGIALILAGIFWRGMIGS